MSVIPITVFFSLLLAAVFVVCFLREHRGRNFAGAERASLLPLADEAPRPAAPPAPCRCDRGDVPACRGCQAARSTPNFVQP